VAGEAAVEEHRLRIDNLAAGHLLLQPVGQAAGVEGRRQVAVVHPPVLPTLLWFQRKTGTSGSRLRTIARKTMTRPSGPRRTHTYYVI